MPHKIIDLHCDSVFSIIGGKNLLCSVPEAHVDLPRLKKGRVGLQVFAAYIPPGTADAFDYSVKLLNAINAFASSDESLIPVETAAEARAAMAADKIGIMAAVENGQAVENSIEKLAQLRRMKVRIMTLVHSEHLPWIGSCTGSGTFSPVDGACKNSGLSSFGEKMIDAMNNIGIIPDVSHACESAFWAVLRRSKKPVIASHSCAYSICAAVRNLKDDQLKALGDSGGLVGVNFCSSFLSESFRLAFEKNNKIPDNNDHVPWTLIADHIDHVVKFAGIDSAAIGSDFDGIPAAPAGVTGSDFYPVLETELRTRGYSEGNIEKIFSANFLRVLEEWD